MRGRIKHILALSCLALSLVYILNSPCALASELMVQSTGPVPVQGTFTVAVSLRQAANDVASFGFSVKYDQGRIRYVNSDDGYLTSGFDFFRVNEPDPGLIKIGGFTAQGGKIYSGDSGEIVKLSFQAIQAGQSSIRIINLVDDMKGWGVQPGSVQITGNKDQSSPNATETNQGGKADTGGVDPQIRALQSPAEKQFFTQDIAGLASADITTAQNRDTDLKTTERDYQASEIQGDNDAGKAIASSQKQDRSSDLTQQNQNGKQDPLSLQNRKKNQAHVQDDDHSANPAESPDTPEQKWRINHQESTNVYELWYNSVVWYVLGFYFLFQLGILLIALSVVLFGLIICMVMYFPYPKRSKAI